MARLDFATDRQVSAAPFAPAATNPAGGRRARIPGIQNRDRRLGAFVTHAGEEQDSRTRRVVFSPLPRPPRLASQQYDLTHDNPRKRRGHVPKRRVPGTISSAEG